MKNLLFLFLLVSLQSCFLFTENWGDEPPMQDSNYKAVLMDRTDFENAVNLQDLSSIEKTGKIYTYSNNIYINDINKGFLVYNNIDPENPHLETFINAPGATDMAIKEGVLYINQATDLIAVEINSDYSSATVTKRIRNVFPEMLSPDGFYEYTPEGKVIVDWKLTEE